MTLLSVSVIIYGGTLMLTSGESMWLKSLVAKDSAVFASIDALHEPISYGHPDSRRGGRVGVGNFGTCRNCTDNHGTGGATCNRYVNSVAQFGSRGILLGFPVRVT
jgi:hypothetical protein